MKFKGLLVLLHVFMMLWGIAGGSASAAVTPASFVNPPSNFQPMNIFFTGFNYNSIVPMAGDKIGAFDGELCVGVYTLPKNYADFTQY